jgi:hypothetical protein
MGVLGTGPDAWAARTKPIALCSAAIFIGLYTEPPQDKNKKHKLLRFGPVAKPEKLTMDN